MVALFAPAPAFPKPAEFARAAAEQCAAGELDAAAASLRALLSAVESSLGPSSDTAQVVQLNLAHVERARGRAAEAAQLEKLPAKTSGGKPDRALKNALRKLRACAAVKSAAKTRAPEIPVQDRVNLADHQYKKGEFRKALTTAEEALASAGAKARPSELMNLYETLALTRNQLGQSEKALEASEAADRYAARAGNAEVRISMARLAMQLGDLERASRRLDAIAATAKTNAARAELEEARGELWLRLGSPREAITRLDRALDAHRKVFGKSHVSTAAVLQLRGDAYRVAGDFPAAMASYEESRRLRVRALGASHADAARTTNAIGVLQADLGDWRTADASFAKALAKLEPALGSGNAEVITVRANRALAHWGAKQSAAAAGEYAQVIVDLSAALGPDHPTVAAAVRNHAAMELELGRAAQAEALLRQALEAQQKRLGPNHPALAPTRLALARIQAREGNLDAAAAETERAIAVLVAARGPDHPVVVRARTLLARIALAQGRSKLAFEQARAASEALTRYTRRTFGAISDRQRALLAEDAQEVIGVLLSVNSAPAREVFLALLPHRDSVLRSSVAARSSTGSGNPELDALRRRYVAAVLGTGPGATERVKKLETQIDALEARAAAGTNTAERDANALLQQACKRLPDDAVLVKLTAYDHTGRGPLEDPKPAYAALVVHGGSCAVERISLGDGAEIAQAAESFAKSMRDQRSDDRAARDTLAAALLAPLAPAVADANRWLVIPDGALWGVPIGVLPDPGTKGKYLFERVTIGYLTSTHELAEARAEGPVASDTLRSLLVGAPEFGGGAGPVVLTSSGPCQMTPFEPLPATAREIEDIEALVGAPAKLTGTRVTKPGIEGALSQDPWLVHFATHAYFAGAEGCAASGAARLGQQEPIAPNPLLLSGIVLANANAPSRIGSEAQGGILTAYEVADLDLDSTGLVVLSACDTGTGLQQRGQEVQGLRWGFRAAGARALVTSLWRSNDVATRRLMKAFYAALVGDELPPDIFRGAEALRRAQLAQVETERRFGLQQPATWANFIFSGVL